MSLRCPRRRDDERGYLMVALLALMSAMAIMLTVALPAWHTLAQREKEAELIFRGEQYARAITLYQRKFANASPSSIDVLVDNKFLRKKYKDPITNDDFQTLMGAPGGSAIRQNPNPPAQGGGAAPPLGQPAAGVGGVVGVVSKSTEKAFRLYNGRDTYNQWIFMGVQQSAQAGGQGGAAGARGVGGRGGDGRGGVDGRGRQGPQVPPPNLPQNPSGRFGR